MGETSNVIISLRLKDRTYRYAVPEDRRIREEENERVETCQGAVSRTSR